MPINDDAGFWIKKISDSMDKRANQSLKRFDLTFSQGKLLLFLMGRSGTKTSQKDIEQFFSVTHPTVIGLLKRLEKKDMVIIRPDEQDGRVRNVFLTDTADLVIEELDSFILETEMLMVRGLSEQDANHFKRLLKKVSSNLD